MLRTKTIVLIFLSFISFGINGCSDSNDAATGGGAPVPTTPKKMFIILNDLSGDFKTAGSGTTGPNGADKLCQADSQSSGGTYKAMLVDGVHRIACTTADCSGGVSEHTDWVLYPNTKYLRADDETIVIGTTNSKGLFDFPLENSWSSQSYDLWMGLGADWTTDSLTCTGFTSSGGNGRVGNSTSTTDGGIFGSIHACNYYGTTILCVEQ